MFPQDTDFFEQENEFVLKIFDRDRLASPNEHYVRIEASQMDKTYQSQITTILTANSPHTTKAKHYTFPSNSLP